MFVKESVSWILALFAIGTCLILCSVIFHLNKIFFLSSILFYFVGFFFMIFFRDPERISGNGIVSPADGKILDIQQNKDMTSISVFMNIFDVHVNRSPLDGKVIDITRVDGSFIQAYKKNSEKNKKVIIEMLTEIGTIKIVQIAGFFARRIVTYLKRNEVIKKNQKIGLIRFGSRVDLLLPTDKIIIKVKIGDRVFAGVSTLCIIKIKQDLST